MIKLEKLVVPTIKEVFVREIEAMILSGKLKVGERLPTEREMAEHMNVSKTIINLGMNDLVAKGFVDVIPRKGIFVADYRKKGKLDSLLSIINFKGGMMDKRAFESLMEFRLVNECEAARLAAKHRSEEDLQKMQAKISSLQNSESIEDFAKHIFEFHHLIFCATNNVIYPLVHNGFEKLSLYVSTIYFQSFETNQAMERINTLYESIQQQTSEQASLAMRNLILIGMEVMDTQYFEPQS
ncbi:MAG: FadR/GntR family transcriptional regulator [Erysipelotrichaceae bacterium]